MFVFTFFFFVPLTVLFMAVSFGCIAYISMGLKQWFAGSKNSNSAWQRSGATAVLLSLVTWAIVFYLYFTYVWLW